MSNKKGDLSELLKYILVAVAGLSFLVFLVYLAQNLSTSGAALSSTEVRETLNDYFTTLSSAEYIQAPADLKLDATLLVNTPTCQHISIQQDEGSSNPSQTTHLMYAPKQLSGKSLQVWSASWFYPYRVTNFFYLTDNRVKIILVGDDALIAQLLQNIPSSMNVEKGTSTNIDDYKDIADDYTFVHIISFGSGTAQEQENIIFTVVKPEGESCVKQADGSERYACHGTVTFSNGQAGFYGMAMLYGSFFTITLEDYQCALTGAQEDLQRISSLYAQKQQLLRQKLSGCNRYNLDFTYSDGGNGWATKASALAEQNKRLGGECEYVF